MLTPQIKSRLQRMLNNLDRREENIILLAGDDEKMTTCAQIGNAAALIPMMQNALLMAIDSLPDPNDRIRTRQLVSTTIMTKDMTDLIDVLRKQGMAGFKEEIK